MGPDEARPRKGGGPVRLAGWLLLAGSAFPVAAAVLFGAQVIISRVWLARYRFGPLEWLWRAATYARVPPLRRVHVEVQPT